MIARRPALVLSALFLLAFLSLVLASGGTEEKSVARMEGRGARIACDLEADRDGCIGRYYETLAKEEGVSRALAIIHEEVVRDERFAGTCHDVMHLIGHVAAHEWESLDSAYAHGDYDCQNGYFHGVVEETVRTLNDELTPEGISGFCEGVPDPASSTPGFARLNCVHGLGHALVYRASGDLGLALSSCSLMNVDEERVECVAGAFMEASIERLTREERNDETRDPALVCATVAGNAGRCWSALAGYAIAISRGAGRGADFCGALEGREYVLACAEGVGRGVADGGGSPASCEPFAKETADACVRGKERRISGETLDERSPLFSPAFKELRWPLSTATDPLLRR